MAMLTDKQISALPKGLYGLLVQSRAKQDCDCAEDLGINPATGLCRSPTGHPTHFDDDGVLRYPNGLEVESYVKYCQRCGCRFDRDGKSIVSQHGPLTIEALLATIATERTDAERYRALKRNIRGCTPNTDQLINEIADSFIEQEREAAAEVAALTVPDPENDLRDAH